VPEFRITDIQDIQSSSCATTDNRFSFRFEVLNWTSVYVGGVLLWLTTASSPGVTLCGAGPTAPGPYLNVDTSCSPPTHAAPLLDYEWQTNFSATLTVQGYGDAYDLLRGLQVPANNTNIPFIDMMQGTPPTQPTDGTCGGFTPTFACTLPGLCPTTGPIPNSPRCPESVDNQLDPSGASNALDGSSVSVCGWSRGKVVQFNWALLDAQGHLFKRDGTPLGSASDTELHPYSYGVLTMARGISAPPLFLNATGTTTDIAQMPVSRPSNCTATPSSPSGDAFTSSIDSSVLVPAKDTTADATIAAALGVTTAQISAAETQVTVVCGNGALNPGEQCDDGNLMSGDGCSATCQLEGIVPKVPATPGTWLGLLGAALGLIGLGVTRARLRGPTTPA
jgi:cysteine-rich repeat protein